MDYQKDLNNHTRPVGMIKKEKKGKKNSKPLHYTSQRKILQVDLFIRETLHSAGKKKTALLGATTC